MLAGWPRGRRGFHRIEWPDHGVILDLAILEAEAALSAWTGPADAWFLDGFAPSKNPEMWRPEVLNLHRRPLGARRARRHFQRRRRRSSRLAGRRLRHQSSAGVRTQEGTARSAPAKPSPRNCAAQRRPPTAESPSSARESPARRWPAASAAWGTRRRCSTRQGPARAPRATPRRWSPRAWTPASAPAPRFTPKRSPARCSFIAEKPPAQ